MELPALELSDEVQQYVAETVKRPRDAAVESSQRADFTELLRILAKPPMFTTLRANVRTNDIRDIQKQVTTALLQQYEAKGWGPPEVLCHPEISDVLVIPSRMALVSPVAAEVTVDLPCGMSVLRGADVFVQGILAAPPGMSPGQLVAVYTDLDRGCTRGLLKPYAGRKVFVGNGVARVSREAVFSGNNAISGVGIQMTAPLYQAPSLDHLLPTLVFAQNLPSIVCARVLDPQPGEAVLDLCAAPGGKTVHIATLMENKGRVVALDKSRGKVFRIHDNCARWGVSCVQAFHFDGTRSIDTDSEPSGCPPYPPGSFDRVLLDAPCSALGQRPSLRNRATLAEVTSYPPLQRKLFSQAVRHLRPGGTLVYSTCTLPREENEALVAWAIRHHPDICLVPQVPHLGGVGWSCDGLSQEQTALLQRFDPGSLTRNCSANHDSSVNRDRSVNHDSSVNRENATESSGDCDCAVGVTQRSSDSADVVHKVNCDTIGFFIAKFVKCDDR